MFGDYICSSYSIYVDPLMKIDEILTTAWWVYVLAVSPFMLFTGGIEEFFGGLFAIFILLLLPLIFYKP